MMSSFVKKEKNQPIQVFVRVRPLNKQEGNTNCIEVKNHKELVIRYHGTPRNYSFDRVFGPGSKQMDVYKLVAEPLVREVISGYNCTVLAYGQTGTGKTYTMAGSSLADGRASTSDISWTEDVDSGIIPRTLSHMFDELRLQNAEYTIRVSYLELYNEEIFDLLSPLDDGQTKIKLYDDTMKKGSVIVNGMTEQTVNSKAEVFKILEKGAEKRKVAATLMNAQSSRSHTVFCIMIHTRENTIDGEDLLKTGKLYLVDLAGSENIKQSGATDVRAREAVSINQSLLTLGRCISKLIERSAHIPFRESKLTRLLQDSLGGRTKTTLIATVSPASCNADESMNTLEYASRAKNITNKPEINQRLSKKMLIKDYSDEIERLRKDLVATRQGKGIYLDEDNYESLIKEIEIYKEEVVEKIAMIRILREEMVKKENLCDQLKISITEHKKVVEEKDSTICSLKDELQTVSKVVVHLQDESKLKEYIVEKYEQTEQQLQTTAKELLTVADTSTTDTRKLHDKLDTLANITKQNKQALEQHLGDWNNKMQRVNNGVRSLYDNIYELHEHMEILSSDIQKSSASTRENVENYMKKLLPLKDKIFDIIEEVNLGTNNIKIQTDQTKSKVDSYFDDIKIKFDLIFNNHLTPIMEGIHTIVDNREAHLEDFIRKINDFNNILIKTIGDSNGVFLFHINEIKRDTNRRVEEVLSAYVFLEEKYKQQNDMLKEYECELDRKNEKINQLLESFKELSGNYATHQRSALDSGWEMINTSKQSLIALKNNCRSTAIQTVKSAEGVFKEVVEQKEVYNNGMIEYETKKQNLDDKYSHAKNELKEAIKEAVTESTQHHNELQLNCLAEISHLRDSFITQYEKPSEIIRESNSILPSLHADMGNDVSFMQESTQMLVNKLMKEVTDHKSYCDQSESEISTEIDDCREGMRKLITSSIKEYNSTGETPQRRSYKYPRTLVVTQPKEKLVEEFYSLRVMADIGEKDENDTGSANVGHANGESRIPIPKKITMEKENDVDKDGHKTDPEEKDIG